MNNELTEQLFHIVRSVSQDLAALNIQRSRDHGLQSYTEYRKFCNLSLVQSFDDLKNEITSSEVRDLLEAVYGDVRNIDLWVGGILEDNLPNSKVGPLFMCIIVDQMKSLRDGDQFWYQNKNMFTTEQLNELKKTNLAQIICENADNIEFIQKNVFLNAKFPEEMIRCSQLDQVFSLKPWKNCCQDNIKDQKCIEPIYSFLPN